MRRLPLRIPSTPPRRAGPSPFLVDPDGDWKSCTPTIPKDCRIIGTVTTEGVTGALARLNHSGNYVKIVAGDVSIVNAIKVQQALAALRGRDALTALEMVPVESATATD